ncbi:MAG: hypothetical protein ACI89L_000230 [Phycisphaerales bacterium]|jgi:hypothetical protein
MSNRFDNFNLLPAWYHDRVAVGQWTRVWAVTLGVAVPVVLVGVALSHFLVVRPAERLADQVRAAETELAERGAQPVAVPTAVRGEARSDPRETIPSQWADLLGLLAEMSGAEIGFEQVEVRIAENHAVELRIEGLAEDSQGVLGFAATVERSGLFAPMSSPSITFDGATGSVRFELSARIVAVAAATEDDP